MTERDEARIRSLRVDAFAQQAALFSMQSYWGSLPQRRVLLVDEEGLPQAHAGFGLRDIAVGDHGPTALRIAGIGAVCVSPAQQRAGLGRQVFEHLRAFLLAHSSVDFAFLACREAIVPFYCAAGFTRFDAPVCCLDPDHGIWQESLGPKIVMSLARPLAAWPPGRINLRGMPW